MLCMVNSLDVIWDKGYKAIMQDESSRGIQEAWVKEAAETLRQIPCEELYKREFIYVPNDTYMIHYFGAEIAEYDYGVYRGDNCNFYKRLVFPVRAFNGEVAGLGGWANDSQWKYLYTPESCWDKSRYFYIHPDDFAKALDDDYLIIVDGIFDAINLNRVGLHAVSLMGSNLSNWHRQYLKFFKYVIVIPDNDNAGVHLVKVMKKYRSDVIVLKQGKYKDVDDYIRVLGESGLIEKFNNLETMSVLRNVVF